MDSVSVRLFVILLVSHLSCIMLASNDVAPTLIYRDSPSNLSYQKAFLRDIKTSRNRAFDLISMRESEMDTLQLSLFFQEPLFTLEVGIGTPTTAARLVFDTAAPLTWTQCEPCVNCFKQDYPIFDPGKSTSFRRLHKNHTVLPAFGCTDPECYYSVATGDGFSSQGMLVMDTFSFLGTLQELKNTVFGCGNGNLGLPGRRKMMYTGILGMGNYPSSLVHQLGDRVMRRFSYCLPTIRSSQTKRSDLRFGGAAVINGENVQTTHFLPQRRHGPLLVQSSYRLNLVGMSVAGRRLNVPKGSFSEGCIIDTGTPQSAINKKAYKVMVDAFSSYFSKYKNIKQIVIRKYPGNLCYKYPKGFRKFPSMKFHFEGANLEISDTSLFMFGRGLNKSYIICLRILEQPMTNILGLYQQQNVWFLFDLGNNKLSFARENC